MTEKTNNKLIVFDLDGTLTDSERVQSKICYEVMPQIDMPHPEFVEWIRGKHLNIILKDIEERFGPPIPEDFVQYYRSRLPDVFAKELETMPGVPAMLEQLKNRGFSMCVASNAPRQKIELALGICGIADYFKENLFSAYDVNAWKPEPVLFLHAVHEMGFTTEESVCIEDSESGCRAALSADIACFHYLPHKGSVYAGTRGFSDMAVLPELLDEHFNRGYS